MLLLLPIEVVNFPISTVFDILISSVIGTYIHFSFSLDVFKNKRKSIWRYQVIKPKNFLTLKGMLPKIFLTLSEIKPERLQAIRLPASCNS